LKIIERFPRPVRVIENQWIPMRDGVRLAARIWMPDDAERDPVPGILELIPYRKRDFTRARDEPMHHYFAGHGYACVRVDVRGTGDSEGVLTDEYSEQELDDAVQAISWIARQPWCVGAVGMTGISWGGFNSLQVAARRPPELRAIITLCSSDDRYADDAHYMGGCLLNENLTWGSVLMAFQVYPPDPEIAGDRWREMWRERLEAARCFPAVWLERQRRDEYWKRGSVCEDYSAIECPVYAIGGWADGYSNAIPRLLAGLRAPSKGLIGPWSHNFPNEGVPGPAIGYLQEALRWWDCWLKGKSNGILDEPRYRVWMEDWIHPEPSRPERPGRWVAEEEWPSPRIRERIYRVGESGLVEEGIPARKSLAMLSPQTAGLNAGDWCAFGAPGEAPAGQRGDDGRSLVFQTEPLDERFEILGQPHVVLNLHCDGPAALIAVRLTDVAPDGASLRISYGLLNLTHWASHERPKALEPGGRFRVEIRLNHCAHSFGPGHRIRLALSTSYWPIAWPSPQPAIVTIHPRDARLLLPERPPSPLDDALLAFEPPEQGPRIETSALLHAKGRRVVERDLTTNEISYTVYSEGDAYDGALTRIADIGLDLGHSLLRRYRIQEWNPLSARAEVEQKTSFRRGDWHVEIETRAVCTSTQDTFRIEAELKAAENGEVVFSRIWDERIPRDLV
jgi:hypothetical protein